MNHCIKMKHLQLSFIIIYLFCNLRHLLLQMQPTTQIWQVSLNKNTIQLNMKKI